MVLLYNAWSPGAALELHPNEPLTPKNIHSNAVANAVPAESENRFTIPLNTSGFYFKRFANTVIFSNSKSCPFVGFAPLGNAAISSISIRLTPGVSRASKSGHR